MIEYIKKDITTVTYGVIAQGVNAQGVQGAGVAKAIRAKWPTVYESYSRICLKYAVDRSALLGQCDVVNVSPPGNSYWIEEIYVANLFTQLNYGHDGKVYASVDSIDKALELCMDFCKNHDLPLYMPRIGCGLGGLRWEDDVLPIVETHATVYDVDTYVCDI